MAQPEEYALDVDADDRVEHVLVIFGGMRPFALDAGVVEKAVDRPVGVERRPHISPDLSRFGHVGGNKPGLAALLANDRGGGFATLGVTVDNHEPGAASGKADRGGSTDAVAAAGDERDLAGEIEVHPVLPELCQRRI